VFLVFEFGDSEQPLSNVFDVFERALFPGFIEQDTRTADQEISFTWQEIEAAGDAVDEFVRYDVAFSDGIVSQGRILLMT
jgi:hypothetical protein